MSIQMSGNAEQFGYHSQTAGGVSPGSGPGSNRAVGMGITPHPSIGASVNYVQGLQGESRNQTFAQGSQEGKSSGGGTGGGILNGIKKIFGGGGSSAEAGAGDAAAGGAAEAAGTGLLEDAAIVAV